MTITTTLLGYLLVSYFVLAAVGVGVSLWRRGVPGIPIGRSLAVAVYLSRVSVALEYYGLRRRERKLVVDDLRSDLGTVEADDIKATIQRLGPPRTLAAELCDGVLRPSLLRGALWFGVATLVGISVAMLVTTSFVAGFEAAAEPGESARWFGLGFDIEATMGTEGRVSGVSFGSLWQVPTSAVAFLVGARLWRIRNRFVTQPEPSTA